MVASMNNSTSWKDKTACKYDGEEKPSPLPLDHGAQRREETPKPRPLSLCTQSRTLGVVFIRPRNSAESGLRATEPERGSPGGQPFVAGGPGAGPE